MCRANGDRALAAYEQCHTTLQRLAEQNPHDAQAARDLVVSHFKLASTAQQMSRPADAGHHLGECHRILTGMRAAGIVLDQPLQQLLEQLDAVLA